MRELLDRITVNPEQCAGQPCIRGMRTRVADIIDLLAAGLSAEQVLEELTDLEIDDVKAALKHAARGMDNPVLIAELLDKQPQGSIWPKLRAISIEGPEDFSENIDLYLSGEKSITNGEIG